MSGKRLNEIIKSWSNKRRAEEWRINKCGSVDFEELKKAFGLYLKKREMNDNSKNSV